MSSRHVSRTKNKHSTYCWCFRNFGVNRWWYGQASLHPGYPKLNCSSPRNRIHRNKKLKTGPYSSWCRLGVEDWPSHHHQILTYLKLAVKTQSLGTVSLGNHSTFSPRFKATTGSDTCFRCLCHVQPWGDGSNSFVLLDVFLGVIIIWRFFWGTCEDWGLLNVVEQ